jgi:acetoin utilization deacetylase AcuC-like enzyme
MDDIKYSMTPWFPKKVVPVREGVYNVRTAGKNSYEHQAKWTGEKWIRTWNEEEVKIKEWQGIAYDPDEHFLRQEFDRIVLEHE